MSVHVWRKGQMANRLVLIKRRGVWFCFAVAVFSLASVAKANTVNVTLTGTVGNTTLAVTDPDAAQPYTNANALIDPYKGTLGVGTGSSPVLLWCVDPDHMDNIGDSWTANVSQLGGDLSNTYLGNANAATYEKMAGLITELRVASTTYAKQELQAAIWELAEQVPGEDGDFVVTAPAGDTNFALNVSNDIKNAPVLTSGFEILTDKRV